MAEDQIEGMRRVRGSSVLVSEIKDDEDDYVNHDDDGNDDYNDGVLVLHLGENMKKYNSTPEYIYFCQGI